MDDDGGNGFVSEGSSRVDHPTGLVSGTRGPPIVSVGCVT